MTSLHKEYRTEELTEYLFHNECGDAQLSIYHLFPGIDLTYTSVHTNQLPYENHPSGSVIQIRHCNEGRIEQHSNNDFYYLVPGDFSIALQEKKSKEYYFPLHHYHGITVTIQTDIVSNSPSFFWDALRVQPLEVAKRFCVNKPYHIIKKQAAVSHIFSEMYSVPAEYQVSYLKLKVMELLLVLSKLDIDLIFDTGRAVSATQAALAKNVANYVDKSPENNFSMENLSHEFHVSQTHLQNAFKGVYGVTVFSYIRTKKIRTAALKLIQSENPIIEIANEVGYENPSKFSAAFKEIMGETPIEYRKAHGMYHG